jgi:hypothetical protein
MRYQQLVIESDYMDNLKDEIINLLTIASSRNIKSLRTSFLVKDLQNIGFDVNIDTILSIMNDLDIVSTADNKKIEIATNDQENNQEEIDVPDFGENKPFGGFEDDTTDPIDAAAKRQATKDIKL